jgi:hypothetical protein
MHIPGYRSLHGPFIISTVVEDSTRYTLSDEDGNPVNDGNEVEEKQLSRA